MVLKLVHISSPGMFWTHYGTDVDEKEDRLQQIIAHNLDRCEGVNDKKEVRCGNVYLAPYKDQADEYHMYYRARVNSITVNGTVNIFFIDYGNVVSVPMKSLRVISVDMIREFPEIVKIPGLALECTMASIQPSKIRNSKGLWDEEVVDRFKQMLSQENCRVEGKISSVTKSGSGHSKFVVTLERLEVTMSNNLDVLNVNEVRHNAKKSRLSGFVAGLGPKTTWDKPEEEITKVERTLAFYPEHDMEIKFDMNVSNQDINTVNKLR